MSKLTAKERKNLPRSAFALPKERAFPVEDKGHAVAAKGRAKEAFEKGRISRHAMQTIDRKANRRLGKRGG